MRKGMHGSILSFISVIRFGFRQSFGLALIHPLITTVTIGSDWVWFCLLLIILVLRATPFLLSRTCCTNAPSTIGHDKAGWSKSSSYPTIIDTRRVNLLRLPAIRVFSKACWAPSSCRQLYLPGLNDGSCTSHSNIRCSSKW